MSAPIAIAVMGGATVLLFYLIDIKFFVGCGAWGMWAKASISPPSELARKAGEAQPVGEADRPHIPRPPW
jgi:hypothetical protein